jgi:hypothetical protein
MPGAELLSLERAVLAYAAPGDPALALMFCAKHLRERGWRACWADGPKFVSSDFASGGYEKSGFSLVFTARQTPGSPGMVTVTLRNMGNVDTRTLPRHVNSLLILGSKTWTTYLIASSVYEVAQATRKALADLGWNEYAPVEVLSDNGLEQQTLKFAKNGMSLKAFVTASLTRRGQTLVQYSASMLSTDLPLPVPAPVPVPVPAVAAAIAGRRETSARAEPPSRQ